MINKLKPCPFCGGEAKLYSNGNHGFFHLCNNGEDAVVKIESRLFSSDEEAIEMWNRRSEPKKGHWIAYKGMQPPEFHGLHYCSNCYHSLHLASNGRVYNYCPRCGAKMEVEE